VQLGELVDFGSTKPASVDIAVRFAAEVATSVATESLD